MRKRKSDLQAQKGGGSGGSGNLVKEGTTYAGAVKGGEAKTYSQGGSSKPRLSAEARKKLFEEKKCFTCHQLGHLARDCPTRVGDKPSGNGGRKDVRVVKR